MRKLYLKKLISILGHLALCLIIYWLGITFISIIANFFKNWFVRFCIGFGIPLALVLIRVHNRRLDNQEMRRAYLAEANRERLVLKEEWHRICKFPHFLAEVLEESDALGQHLVYAGVGFGAGPFVGGFCWFDCGLVCWSFLAGPISVGPVHCIGLLIRLKQRWSDEDYA